MKKKKEENIDIENLTISSAFEHIYATMKESGLTSEYYKQQEKVFDFICTQMNISAFQATVIALVLNDVGSMSISEMSAYTKCPPFRFIRNKTAMNELHRKRYIRWSLAFRDNIEYSASDELVEAITTDKVYIPKPFCEYTTDEVYEQITKWLNMLDHQSELFNVIVEEIKFLLKNTGHLTFSRDIMSFELTDHQMIALLVTIYYKIDRNTLVVNINTFVSYMPYEARFKTFTLFMENGTSRLLTLGLMENCNVDGMADQARFGLTDNFIDRTLVDLKDFIKENQEHNKLLIMPDKITVKEMFYNQSEASKINRLEKLLSKDEFDNIQERLRQANMRTGFACLFYGSPGTGKTETVMQLAKRTGRSIFMVNISEIKSKWVGESEKNIQNLFRQYEALVKKNKICPILLFNEADAIISKRSSNVDAAVDKMENACQNIILQAMENLSGIMIATTNLTDNMDKAFERRFLYKIRFEKPNPDIKSKIWQSMVKGISESDAQVLSKSFDFSGGQIENIARKQTVDSILYGTSVSVDAIEKLCKEENINNNKVRIGF